MPKIVGINSIVLFYFNGKKYDQKLQLKNHSTCDSLVRKLQGINFSSIKKVSIELVKDQKNEWYVENEGVFLFQSSLESVGVTLEDLIKSESSRLLLISKVFQIVAKEKKIDADEINQIFNDAITNGLIRTNYGSKIYSNDKCFYSILTCINTDDKFELFIEVFRDEYNELIKSTRLVKTSPFYPVYKDFLLPINYSLKKDSFNYESKKKKLKIEIELKEFR